MLRSGEGRRLLVISPHLDDAVFGCSARIAQHPGALVATLFAGTPRPPVPLTPWDADCGFSSAEQAIAERRREDAAALHALAARPCWMDFPDAQYRSAPPDSTALRVPIDELLGSYRPHECLFPLGLFHEDHKLAHEVALDAVRDARGVRALAYEDALYRRIPGLVASRLESWRAAGIAFRFAGECAPAPGKRRAAQCYASQLRGLATTGRPGHADLDAPERYWALGDTR